MYFTSMYLVAEDKHAEYAPEVFSINQLYNCEKLSLLCRTRNQGSRSD